MDRTTATISRLPIFAKLVVGPGRHEFGRVMAIFPEVRARVEAAVARRPHAEDS